jgi:hypothetical protein
MGIKHIKPAMNRLHNWSHHYYYEHLPELQAPCLRCGKMVPFQILSSIRDAEPLDFQGLYLDLPGLYQRCHDCQLYNWTTIAGLIHSHPAGQEFIRQHPRSHALPIQQIETAGRLAYVAHFESLTDNARLEAVFACDNMQLLSVNGRAI